MVEIFAKITSELLGKVKGVIVGINGVDCSGKTTFTTRYSEYLASLGIKNTVIHIDDFHNPLKLRRKGENEIDAYYENAFNYEQLINELFEPLKKHGSIDKEVLCLNLDTDKYENIRNYQIDEETVILVEGVLLFRPPLIEYLDKKVYLHVDFEEVLKRAAARDVPKYGEAFLDKYKNKYIPIQKRYLQEYSPEAICDILVDNNDYMSPKLKVKG